MLFSIPFLSTSTNLHSPLLLHHVQTGLIRDEPTRVIAMPSTLTRRRTHESDHEVGETRVRLAEVAQVADLAEAMHGVWCNRKKCSQSGTRTRVCWVRASYPNRLDKLGSLTLLPPHKTTH